MEEFTQRPAPASQKSIKLGGKTVKYSLYAAKIGNGKGAVMDAYPQGCDECRWAQTVSRTGSGAMDEQTDVLPIEKGQPIYPTGSPTLNNFSDQPNSQEPGSFTAVTSLGIPDRSAKTFNVLGSMTWGYALDAGGNVITTGPRISSAAEQERSMGVLRRDSPGWTIGP
jgi:hypothetical protein